LIFFFAKQLISVSLGEHLYKGWSKLPVHKFQRELESKTPTQLHQYISMDTKVRKKLGAVAGLTAMPNCENHPGLFVYLSTPLYDVKPMIKS